MTSLFSFSEEEQDVPLDGKDRSDSPEDNERNIELLKSKYYRKGIIT